MSATAVTVTTNATLLIDQNPQRIYLRIINTSANEVDIADVSTVTVSTGIPIATTKEEIFLPPTNNLNQYYTGPWYGIAGSSSVVRVIELERQQP